MTTADLKSVLHLFSTPASAAMASERSGLPLPVLHGLLRQLQARGLVTPADPGVGACSSGCGHCSLQNFCPASEESEGEEPFAPAHNPRVWRLTPLGEQTAGQE